jgi:hypothetical protein
MYMKKKKEKKKEGEEMLLCPTGNRSHILQ